MEQEVGTNLGCDVEKYPALQSVEYGSSAIKHWAYTWCCNATQGHESCSCASLSQYFVCLAQLLSNCVSFSQGLAPDLWLATLPERREHA